MGCGYDQPVILVLMDSYTLVLSHQSDFLDYHCELHWSSGPTKQSFELVGLTLDMKMQVFPGLWAYWLIIDLFYCLFLQNCM